MDAMRARWLTWPVLVCALAGCGSGGGGEGADATRTTGGDDTRPVVRLATKNFTEQVILGELYARALRARGFRVDLKRNVGSAEIVDRARLGGGIDMYPEYTGVIVHELA